MNRCGRICALGLLVLAGSGCGDVEDMEPPALVQDRAAPVLEQAGAEAEALRLVQQHPAPDGEGTVEDWVRRHMEAGGMDVLFPNWKVVRLAAGRFEVLFSYTCVTSDTVDRRGWAWLVNLPLLTVSPPRELTPEELTPPEKRPFAVRSGTRPPLPAPVHLEE